MTRTKRVLHILQGLLMILFAAILIMDPEVGLQVVLVIISVGMTLRGIRALAYYFSMARFMVGGKSLLYKGILYLDVGLFVSSLINTAAVSVMLYVAAADMIAGLLSVLDAREARGQGSPRWKYRAAYGAVMILLAVMVLAVGLILRKNAFVVYVYAAGLVYSALFRIAGAFRRTAIVYIP